MIRNEMKELTEGMQRLCAVANRVVASEGAVSRIEKELMLDVLRRLYEVVIGLEDSGAERRGAGAGEEAVDEGLISSAVMATMSAMAPVVPEPEMPSADTPSEPPMEEAAAEILLDEAIPTVEPEPIPEPEEPVVATVPPSMAEFEVEGGLLFEDELAEASGEELPDVEPEEPAAPEQPVAEVPAAPAEPAAPAAGQAEEVRQPSLLDYLKHPVSEQSPVMTLGERLSGGAVPGVEALVKKVDDLRTVININDKFSFMQELFGNNMRGYNDFIMHLNSLTSREEALAHVREVAAQYKWNEDSPVVRAFYRVFDKKF